MARRMRLKAHHHQPTPRTTAYIMPAKTAAEARRKRGTTPTARSPYHEGLKDAQRSGERGSRRFSLGLAKNGAPHQDEVATDHRIRKAERKRAKLNNHFRKLHRKLDPSL